MFALVAFKRPDPAHAGKFQVGFEVRNFGCFNGFNNMEAFTHRETFDLMFNNVNPDGTLYPSNYSGDSTLRALAERTVTGAPLHDVGANPQGWECLGIGFMIHHVGEYSGPANATAVGQDRVGQFRLTSKQTNDKISKLVNWAGIYRQQLQMYEDFPVHRSKRVYTPNEEFLDKLFSQVTHANGGYHIAQTWANRNTQSRFAQALGWSRLYHYTLHQWVGSERPSGLAVSYLQIWRNVVQGAHEGFSARKGMLTFLWNCFQPHWPTSHDPMPALSCLINNGSDSDIVSFAGCNFVSYATRWGLLNCKDLYRESVSMIEERRYNKGGQSETITRKLREAIGRRRDVTWSSLDGAASPAIGALVEYTQGLKAVYDQSDMSMLLNYSGLEGYEGRIDGRLQQLNALLRRVMSVRPETYVRGVVTASNMFPDLALPPPAGTPETASDGAAMGFNQWVATAEPAQTIH